MHTSFQDEAISRQYDPPSYANWLGELRVLFPVRDEFLLADAIFHFSDCYVSGLTPQEAYDKFDEFVNAEAA